MQLWLHLDEKYTLLLVSIFLLFSPQDDIEWDEP